VLALASLFAAPLPGRSEPPKAGDADEVLAGFSLTPTTVAKGTIIAGGPKRDAILAVDDPQFVPAAEARHVRGDTPVIGVVVGGEARAYPVHVMEYHQLVNDVIGGVPIVVTYDPLIDSAIAYRATLGAVHDAALDAAPDAAPDAARNTAPDAPPEEKPQRFGVSGLIHSSNFLLYDRASESLWSQFLGVAIAGQRVGQQLEPVRTRIESMARWLEREPSTLVLALPDKYRIDYRHSLYSTYWVSKEIAFPVESLDDRLHPKELVLGAVVGGKTRAYLASVVTRAGGRVIDDFAGHSVRVVFDERSGTFEYEAPGEVRLLNAYWFAWRAFHPAGEIWQPKIEAGD
jgi:hypothetical protein